MSDYAYQNLRTPQNVSQSGIAEYALLAPKNWFEDGGIKAPVAPFTNQGDSLKIKTAHVFKAGKGFIYFDLAPEKNKLDIKASGNPGFVRQNIEVDIFIPGSYVEAHEQVKNLLNVKLVAIVKDADCPSNLYYHLGCDCQFAYLTADFTTGTTKDGEKGYAGKLTYSGGIQFYDYATAGEPEVIDDLS